MNKRLHIYYSGEVQGVGFRFAAERTAITFGITGWAKNLSDGRVEILCEGPEAHLKQFLEKIAGIFRNYIRDTSSEWEEATGEFEYFDIKI